MKAHQTFAVEFNGDSWQSVFPSRYADLSQTHNTVLDALEYMAEQVALLGNEANVPEELLR